MDLPLASNLNWALHQMDIKNAFLKELNEEAYMDLPLGFDRTPGNTEVCKLKKSLYGLNIS